MKNVVGCWYFSGKVKQTFPLAKAENKIHENRCAAWEIRKQLKSHQQNHVGDDEHENACCVLFM